MFREGIQNNQYVYFKKHFDDSYNVSINFNDLFDMYSKDESEPESLIRGKFSPQPNDILSKVFQIRSVTNTRFSKMMNELNEETKKHFDYKYMTLDFFFFFKPTIGNVHHDGEHVCIIGSHGTTYYNFPSINSQVKIEKGDMLFIPRTLKHNVMSPGPRIIISVGFYVN